MFQVAHYSNRLCTSKITIKRKILEFNIIISLYKLQLNILQRLNMESILSFDTLMSMRKYNTAWRVLRADSAPFIISFFYKTFITKNRRAIKYSDLLSELDDYIYDLNQKFGEEVPKQSAREYIESWSRGEFAFLNQRYIGRGDEPEVDLTPGIEKAIRWLEGLQDRSFVGTESRLLTIILLLRDLVQKTESDPQKVLKNLQQQRLEIDKQIEDLKEKGWRKHGSTQVKERYFQILDTTRDFLADFRQVEDNFRNLDRNIREKIAISDKEKGELLEDIFGEHDAISNSDQGKSFRAFWEFLIQAQKQNEFEQLVSHVLKLPEVQEMPENVLSNFKDFLLEAGNKVYQVNNHLTSQLRKYIEDRGVLENKRILELVRIIEKQSIGLLDHAYQKGYKTTKKFVEVPMLSPEINLKINRRLFRVPGKEETVKMPTEVETSGTNKVSVNSLFEQEYVDEERLCQQIEELVETRGQVSLRDVIKHFPLEKGISELVTYLKIATNRKGTVFDEDKTCSILISNDNRAKNRSVNEGLRKVKCPQVIFIKL